MISSGSGTFRIGGRRVAVVVAACALALGAIPAWAQSVGAPVEFELGRSVQQTLSRTQELWLQWVGATLQDNRARSEEALRGLSVAAHEIGFSYFPELALGALAQARQSAASGNFGRARLQIAAAEVLDPGRSEVLFAEAAIARAQGQWVAAWVATLKGMGRSFAVPEGDQLAASIGLWILLVLLVATAVFVALLVGRYGAQALRVLHGAMVPPLQDWAAAGVVAFAVCAPLVLPHGVFWWLMLASGFVWTFASRSQRAVLVVGWLATAVTPIVTDQLQRRQALAHTPPMRSFAAFEEGRLYGGFFSDLQVLRSALPEKPAAIEMVADVHRTLGQWDVARSLYRRVLLDEPDNIPVLLNLGAFYFRKGDHAVANAYFERATKHSTPSAAAWYNLSQGYSDAYMFDESRDALGKARAIDGRAVDSWIATSNPDRVLTFNGSLGRRAEIEADLEAAWRGRRANDEGERSGFLQAFAFPLVAAIVGLGFGALRRRAGSRAARQAALPSGKIGNWLRLLLPMIDATERGEGARALGHVFLLTALLLVPKLFGLMGDPWFSGWPDGTGALWLAGLGLALYFGLRARGAWALSED